MPDVEDGNIYDISITASGAITVGGIVKNDTVVFDWTHQVKAPTASLFVAWIDKPKVEENVPDISSPNPVSEEDDTSYMMPVAIVITLVVAIVYCFCWKGKKMTKFRERRKGPYSRVNDFEMDNVEDVTVFAIDDENPRH